MFGFNFQIIIYGFCLAYNMQIEYFDKTAIITVFSIQIELRLAKS